MALLLIPALAGQGSVAAWAADISTLSLPPLLEELRRASPELLAARKRWEAARVGARQATGLPAPRIGVEFEELPKGTFKVNQATIMYQLIQSLPFPGKLSAKKAVAAKEAQLAAVELKRMEWDLASQLKTAYYELYMVDRELEIQQELIAWLRQAVAGAQAGYATATTSQASVLQAQSELLEASSALTTLEHRREAMAAHLNHLLNRTTHAPVGRPGPLELVPLTYTIEELVLVAEQQQPELLAAQYSVERADATVRLSKRELLPDLETMAELRDPAMGPIGPWDLTLALTLPFWFWTKARYGVQVAVYDAESARAAQQAVRNAVLKGIHEHWHEAQGAYTTAALTRDGLLPLEQQAVASALTAYQTRRSGFAELTEVLGRWSRRKMEYYRQLVMLEQHVIMLEEAVGIPLRAAHGATEGDVS